jgi:Tfp pilus assembly protein PilF
MRALLAAAVLAALATTATTAAAQKKGREPERPRLPAGADTNDAESYHKYAMQRDVPWKKSYDAEYWAYRIDPLQPAYLYAQWLSLWYKQAPQWREEFRAGAEFAVKSKEARELDSLFLQAQIQDPFVHLYNTVCYVPDWITQVRSVVTRAYVYYDVGCHTQAAATFDTALAKHPKRLGMRLDRARASYWVGHYGNAIKELRIVLDTLRARDQKKLVHAYESKEMLEYMLGATYARDGQYALAREAYGRALEEDLSFYMAHAHLADVARAQGDIATAVQEYETAVQLKPDAVALRHEYGRALLDAQPRRNEDAEAQFRKAIELDPYFATSYFNLAVALDNQDKKAEAVEQYTAYLARAPRDDAKPIARARERLAALTTASK